MILRIAPQCDDMLRVTVANMKSPNVKGFHTNRPLNSQKKGGPYLSVPLMSAVTDWGMPVDMKFEPADTQLKKARIGLLRGDILHMSDVDVLDKGYLVGKGHFRFKDLIIPVFGIERFNGTAQLVMELTGEREGKKLTSIPEDDEPVIFNGGASNFIPLFLAGDYLDVFRRYGSHSGAANRGGLVGYRFNHSVADSQRFSL